MVVSFNKACSLIPVCRESFAILMRRDFLTANNVITGPLTARPYNPDELRL
jgi:hypothetical protein